MHKVADSRSHKRRCIRGHCHTLLSVAMATRSISLSKFLLDDRGHGEEVYHSLCPFGRRNPTAVDDGYLGHALNALVAERLIGQLRPPEGIRAHGKLTQLLQVIKALRSRGKKVNRKSVQSK